jgi:signal transduction histidine kinase
VRYLSDRVEIEVVDDGPRRPTTRPEASGRGLIGMRERMALYGGTLHAGPRREGGFHVHACVPLTRAVA